MDRYRKGLPFLPHGGKRPDVRTLLRLGLNPEQLASLSEVEQQIYLDAIIKVALQDPGESWDAMIAEKYSTSIFDGEGGDWLDPTNTVIGGIGVVAGLGEFTLGKLTIGDNFRIYASGWGGSQHVTTWKMSGIAKGTGRIIIGLSTTLDGYGVYNYYFNPLSSNIVHPSKAALNLTVGLVSAKLGLPGLVFSTVYFGVDAFYPGGWPAALENNQRITQQMQEILDDPTWNLYRGYP